MNTNLKTNGFGIASMVIGIVALLLTCCYGGFLGIIGLILAIVGMCIKGYKRGFAIAGLVLNIISVCSLALILLGVISTYSGFTDNDGIEVNNVSNAPEQITTSTPEESNSDGKEEFISSCQIISYEELSRTPNDYIGKKIMLTVKVQQVMQGGLLDDSEYYRVNTNDEYNWWQGDEYVMYDCRIDDNTKILKDDILTVYAEFEGMETVKRALTGTKEDIPAIKVYYSEIGPQVPENQIAVTGDTIETPKYIINYVSADDNCKSYNKYNKPEEGNKVVAIYLEIENVSTEDQYVSSLDFECYADGYSVSRFYGLDDEIGATLSPGRKASGSVAFEVPENAEEIEVEYEVNAWTGEKIIFKVK